jgi:hypothetical protein
VPRIRKKPAETELPLTRVGSPVPYRMGVQDRKAEICEKLALSFRMSSISG